MSFQKSYINELLSDNRHKDIGLSDEEGRYVIIICKKFMNRRDHLDDLYQTALLSLIKAFNRQTEINKPIQHRKRFIYSVVRNSMCAQIVRKNKKDLIYKSLNLYTNIEHFENNIQSLSPTKSEDTEPVYDQEFVIEEYWIDIEYD